LYLIRDTDNLRQPFPTFYVCDAKVANGMWFATLPWKR
jgi:hypothetical protein